MMKKMINTRGSLYLFIVLNLPALILYLLATLLAFKARYNVGPSLFILGFVYVIYQEAMGPWILVLSGLSLLFLIRYLKKCQIIGESPT